MNTTKEDRELFEQTASVYKLARESFPKIKNMKGTRQEILEHLSTAVFLLATLNIKEIKTSVEVTNKFLEDNNLPELKITF